MTKELRLEEVRPEDQRLHYATEPGVGIWYVRPKDYVDVAIAIIAPELDREFDEDEDGKSLTVTPTFARVLISPKGGAWRDLTIAEEEEFLDDVRAYISGADWDQI
jgi:hypothetical protein